jgi:hypothetical protein
MDDIPFLANLGITAFQAARPPTAQTFPLAFPASNVLHWRQACTELVPSLDIKYDWGITIRRYVELCTQNNVFPFATLHQSRNDQISDYLAERRRAFVKFINMTGLLEHVYLKATHRTVTAIDSGFTLRVHGEAIIEDPTYTTFLQKAPFPRMLLRTEDQHYVRQLMPGLELFAYNEYNRSMKQRWIVGYEITCPIFPDLPNHPTPTKAEIERFILDLLWMPLLRSMRPIHQMRRLI